MALIECPKCGKQISYKAIRCPQCGIEVQKELEEIREKEWQQMKKHRRRIIISIVSIFVVAAIAIVGYMYYIDARKQATRKAYLQKINHADLYFLYDITGDKIPELWLLNDTLNLNWRDYYRGYYCDYAIYTYNKGIERLYSKEFKCSASEIYFYAYKDYVHCDWGYRLEGCLKLKYSDLDHRIISSRLGYDEGESERVHRYGILLKVYSTDNKQPILDAFAVK